MKKIILSLVLGVLLINSVLAISPFAYKSFNIKVVHKNPEDWSTVNGGSGNVLLSHGVINPRIDGVIVPQIQFRAKAILLGLEPFTDYTLIYYGDKTHNDIWNYATCITNGITNKHGNVRLEEGLFDYSGFVNDDKAQKFWVVPTKDLDCANHKFIAWNPTEYLFETRTI